MLLTCACLIPFVNLRGVLFVEAFIAKHWDRNALERIAAPSVRRIVSSLSDRDKAEESSQRQNQSIHQLACPSLSMCTTIW